MYAIMSHFTYGGIGILFQKHTFFNINTTCMLISENDNKNKYRSFKKIHTWRCWLITPMVVITLRAQAALETFHF